MPTSTSTFAGNAGTSNNNSGSSGTSSSEDLFGLLALLAIPLIAGVFLLWWAQHKRRWCFSNRRKPDRGTRPNKHRHDSNYNMQILPGQATSHGPEVPPGSQQTLQGPHQDGMFQPLGQGPMPYDAQQNGDPRRETRIYGGSTAPSDLSARLSPDIAQPWPQYPNWPHQYAFANHTPSMSPQQADPIQR